MGWTPNVHPFEILYTSPQAEFSKNLQADDLQQQIIDGTFNAKSLSVPASTDRRCFMSDSAGT
jgi:hypothetical protein